jgi:hypothetical protein
MPLIRSERERLIQQYADGPARLVSALARVPAEARQWRPVPGEWSAHEDHGHPVEPARATVRAVRVHTVALVRRLPEAAWSREGRPTASGRYTAEDWLGIYAEHLEIHARQIEANVAAWEAAARPR